jgi:hypothetical protein
MMERVSGQFPGLYDFLKHPPPGAYAFYVPCIPVFAGEEDKMMIRVVYTTGNYDMVKDIFLDKLISSGKVSKFYRSNRWAVVGRDPVRGMGGSAKGTGRRMFDH